MAQRPMLLPHHLIINKPIEKSFLIGKQIGFFVHPLFFLLFDIRNCVYNCQTVSVGERCPPNYPTDSEAGGD